MMQLDQEARILWQIQMKENPRRESKLVNKKNLLKCAQCEDQEQLTMKNVLHVAHDINIKVYLVYIFNI